MADSDEFLLAKNWERLEKNKAAVAQRLRDLADDIDRISMTNRQGEKRDPIGIVGEVEHTLKWGIVNAPLGAMFTWAGAIYEARDYQNKKEV